MRESIRTPVFDTRLGSPPLFDSGAETEEIAVQTWLTGEARAVDRFAAIAPPGNFLGRHSRMTARIPFEDEGHNRPAGFHPGVGLIASRRVL